MAPDIYIIYYAISREFGDLLSKPEGTEHWVLSQELAVRLEMDLVLQFIGKVYASVRVLSPCSFFTDPSLTSHRQGQCCVL